LTPRALAKVSPGDGFNGSFARIAFPVGMAYLASSPFRRSYDWLDQVFINRAAESGGIIKRQIIDVDREVGRAAFEAEVKRRGFSLIRTRTHYVIVCDKGPIERLF
jgi:hypothetical protein